MKKDLDDKIRQLYDTFSVYPLNRGMEGCPCCVKDTDKMRLLSKPLRELAADDLSKYYWKAMTTWGAVDDFKHFWQHYEHYPLSPREIQVDILSDSGSNYWKSRWDNCNDFFCGLIKIIPNSVQPEGAFLMQSAQDDYVRKYGNERPK